MKPDMSPFIVALAKHFGPKARPVAKLSDPETSYTAKLLAGPLRRTAQKVGEEGVETALAAVCEPSDKLTSEAADLVYHLLVLLAAKDIPLTDVIEELKSRHT